MKMVFSGEDKRRNVIPLGQISWDEPMVFIMVLHYVHFINSIIICIIPKLCPV